MTADTYPEQLAEWSGAGPQLPDDLLDQARAVGAELSWLVPDPRRITDFGSALAWIAEVDGALAAQLERADGPPEWAWGLARAALVVRRLDHRLLELQLERRSRVVEMVAAVLPKLEAASHSVAELVSVAPELVCELGFDRGMVSRVQDDVWYPELVFVVAGDLSAAERIAEAGNSRPPMIIEPMPEAELLRGRRAILVAQVRGPGDPSRGHHAMILASGTRSYVAASIVSGGRVVGMLHADCHAQRRRVDSVDRDLLGAFAETFQLALSRAVLNERLGAARTRLSQVSSALADLSGAVDAMPVVRAARRAGEPSGDMLVRVGPRPGTTSLDEMLTSREIEVLALMAAGCTNAAIARRLTIADGTAKKHVMHVLRKLGVANRSEAVASWFQSGHVAEPGAYPQMSTE